jgi:Predicted ATPase
MVISTTRAVSGEYERRFSNQITVGTFSFQESKQVVHSLIDESELGLAVRIYEQSGGNALFIEELCRSAMASELDLRVLKDSLKIPTSLHGLIAARMSRLSDEGQAIARAAAVIGHVYDIPLLEFVLEHGVAEHQIQALVDAGIFFSSDSHRAIHFKHGVIRDTLYSAIGLKEKKCYINVLWGRCLFITTPSPLKRIMSVSPTTTVSAAIRSRQLSLPLKRGKKR